MIDTNKKTISKNYLKTLAGSTFFTVKFIKKDGSIRLMRCRMGVTKNLNPNSKGLSPTQKKQLDILPHLIVTDINKDDYRKINCDTILSIAARGLRLERETLTESFKEI